MLIYTALLLCLQRIKFISCWLVINQGVSVGFVKKKASRRLFLFRLCEVLRVTYYLTFGRIQYGAEDVYSRLLALWPADPVQARFLWSVWFSILEPL